VSLRITLLPAIIAVLAPADQILLSRGHVSVSDCFEERCGTLILAGTAVRDAQARG
jgi:hypothetical protein